jgi:hypothetical protein
MVSLAPSANGQTVTSSGNSADSAFVDLPPPAREGAGPVALRIRDWPLANARVGIPLGDAPTRVAASDTKSGTRTVRRRSRATRAAQRVTAGVAMGILGGLAGGLAGAGVGGAVGREYAPLYGFAIGGTIGAGAGAALGVLMVR